MSDIAKNLFEKDPKRWYDGFSSLEELNENMHGFEGTLHGYLLILNETDFDAYDERLSKLEMDYEMCSAHMEFLKESLGFQEIGETVRTAIFNSEQHHPNGEINSDKIKEILGDVLYDLYKFQ
jgi:hypothetical protein